MTSPDQTVAAVGEHALIARIRAKVPSPPAWVYIGLGDDAAAIEPERGTIDVLTTDALVDGVHFDRRFCPADAIGHRALAVNLSDLAAMGAAPRVALLSLVLPGTWPLAEFDALLDGVLGLAAETGTVLVGGNITQSPGPLIVDVTAVGSAGRRKLLRRSGARPGDDVYVTGTIGTAAAGLAVLRQGLGGVNGRWTACEARYLRPRPRLRIGRQLGRGRVASACIDLSDGLGDGVAQLAAASGVGMTIDAASMPLDADARAWFEERGEDPIRAALTGGDDYELLFTVPRRFRGRLRTVRSAASGVAITRIGIVTPGHAVVLRRGEHDEPWPGGYEHFRC